MSFFIDFFNCSRTNFAAIIVNVLVFLMQIFLLDRFCSVSCRTFFDFSINFFTLCSFFSNLYCSHSEMKLVAKIKLIAAKHQERPDSRVGSASGGEEGGPWFECRRALIILHP